ncbi:MAG: DUF4880 domain-containing protein, partial [Nitrosomonas sp. PRO5]|nr:DUF4880 domain-containing protein [Nitrosomonas sp. PRO5]
MTSLPKASLIVDVVYVHPHNEDMTTSGENEDRATSEAAHWLIALEDDPNNAALRTQFDEWLAASPVNAAAWAHTTDIYDMMAKAQPAHTEHWAPYAAEQSRMASATLPGAISASRHLTSARSWQSKIFTPWRVASGMAIAVLAVSFILMAMPTVFVRLEADYATSTA